MKKLIFIFGFFVTITYAHGQYWFGPKVGIHGVSHRYQLEEYKSDSFNIRPDLRWQVGAVLTYTASDRYSVHTEINFERIGRTLKNDQGQFPAVFSKTKFSFLTVPLLLRVNFGRAPFHYYLNGGPKISYWLSGSGKLTDLEEFIEFQNADYVLDYEIVFKSKNERPPNDEGNNARLHLENGNRLQYALTLGGGAYFDISNGARIMLDFRYSFGHSNMGFNDNTAFTFDDYEENFEYTHDMLSISVAYMFEYNAQLQRKGKSTNKLSNKKKR